MFDRDILCGTGDLEWLKETLPENVRERAGKVDQKWFDHGSRRPVVGDSANSRPDSTVRASDIDDTVKRYKSIRGSIIGSTGQPTDFLNPGQSVADPDETIHEAVNDTEWWLK